MQKILESNTKIRFQDCDPFNHLNNSKYIDYFINAREDQVFDSYGIDIYMHSVTEGKSWVVNSNQIVYLKPAFLMEEVLIQSQLIDFDETSLLVEMKMWNKDKTSLKSVFWSRFVYIDLKTQKRTSHPEGLMSLFRDVKTETGSMVFEQRCKDILESLKSAV